MTPQFAPGIGQPMDFGAMAQGQGLWNPAQLAQGLEMIRVHALRELFDSGVKTVRKSPKLLVFISLVNMLLILRNVSA